MIASQNQWILIHYRILYTGTNKNHSFRQNYTTFSGVYTWPKTFLHPIESNPNIQLYEHSTPQLPTWLTRSRNKKVKRKLHSISLNYEKRLKVKKNPCKNVRTVKYIYAILSNFWDLLDVEIKAEVHTKKKTQRQQQIGISITFLIWRGEQHRYTIIIMQRWFAFMRKLTFSRTAKWKFGWIWNDFVSIFHIFVPDAVVIIFCCMKKKKTICFNLSWSFFARRDAIRWQCSFLWSKHSTQHSYRTF